MSAIKVVIWDFSGVVLQIVKGTFNSLLAGQLDVPLEKMNRVMAMEGSMLWDIDEINDDVFFTFLLSDRNSQKGEKNDVDQRKNEYIQKDRKNSGRRADNPISIMGSYNVPFSTGGCAAII